MYRHWKVKDRSSYLEYCKNKYGKAWVKYEHSDKKKTLSNEIIAGYCVLPEVFFTFRIKRKFKLEKNQEAVQPRIGSASNMNHLYPTHTHARTFYLL